ncbi:MAG: hypothetical protein Q8O24_02140 [Gallionellaceae bacterium]|nr:hypothetical protein [Gallionellaceae bacterium]
MSYQSRKSMNMDLSETFGGDSDFQLSPTVAVVLVVVLAFLLMVVK